MMDKAAREKARELCEKATPGPWVSEHEVTGRVPDAGCGIVASDDHTKISNPSRGIVAWACRLVSRTNAETKANAAFVAAARTLLPQALDALDAADSDNARLQARVSELEAAQELRPISEAPKNQPILAYCDHEADPWSLGDGKHLTLYAAHAEGTSFAPTGFHIVEWGGGFSDHEDDGGSWLPDWWFVAGSEFEVAANPILWCDLPAPPVGDR